MNKEANGQEYRATSKAFMRSEKNRTANQEGLEERMMFGLQCPRDYKNWKGGSAPGCLELDGRARLGCPHGCLELIARAGLESETALFSQAGHSRECFLTHPT